MAVRDPDGGRRRRGGHVLAIDVGTSAVRVSAVSLSGEIRATERIPCRPSIEGDRAELDAEALWSDIGGLIRRVAGQAGGRAANGEPPLALGVACQLGMVVADDRLRPIGPAILWPDRRAAVEAEELRAALGPRAGEIAGRAVSAELAAPRLRWLARHEPDLWRRTRWVLSLKDYLIARATGQVLTDATSASYSLLFAVRERSWAEELAAAVDVPVERLPAVVGAAEDGAVLRPDAAAAFGLPAGLPVAIGGPDGSVAALGSGAVAAGRIVDVAGSTDVLVRVVDRPIGDPAARCVLNAFLLPGLWTVGGPTGLTGGTIAWLTATLGHPSAEAAYRALGHEVAAFAPGAGGVAFRTALTGERFPGWAGGTGGTISGIRPEHGPAHLLRAAEEGAAFAVREGLEAIAALGLAIEEIRVCGGVAHRPEAMQLRASAWQRRVVAVTNPEATTIGAAMLAAVRAGAFASIEDAEAAMIRLDPPIDPDPTSALTWGAAYSRWRAIAPPGSVSRRQARRG